MSEASSAVPASGEPVTTPAPASGASAQPAPLTGATLALGTVALSLATFMDAIVTRIAKFPLDVDRTYPIVSAAPSFGLLELVAL